MSRNQSNRPLANQARLHLEILEGRETPSGNVTAALSAGSLTVVGDAANNLIAVTQYAFGDLLIQGLGGTMVNGQPLLYLRGATLAQATFAMQGGADQVQIQNLRLPGNLTLDLGDGNDTAWLTNISAGGNLTVLGGAGDDSVFANYLTAGSLLVDGGVGINSLSLGQVTAAGNLSVISGIGADRVWVSGATAGNLSVSTGDGADLITLYGVRVNHNLSVDAGTGNDSVAVTNVSAAGIATILGGLGTDTLTNGGITSGLGRSIQGFERSA
jgi:hypothetical protein